MIQQGLTSSFKSDLLSSLAGADVKIALYVEAANLSPKTPAYTTAGEVVAPGYTAGGKSLTGFKVVMDGGVAYATWDTPVVWPAATITARGALIYNATNWKSIAVVDFKKDVSSTDDDFKVKLPAPGGTTALIRIA